jgi:hypothetical protein
MGGGDQELESRRRAATSDWGGRRAVGAKGRTGGRLQCQVQAGRDGGEWDSKGRDGAGAGAGAEGEGGGRRRRRRRREGEEEEEEEEEKEEAQAEAVAEAEKQQQRAVCRRRQSRSKLALEGRAASGVIGGCDAGTVWLVPCKEG